MTKPADEKQTPRPAEPDPALIPPPPAGSDGLQGARPGSIYSPGEGISEEHARRTSPEEEASSEGSESVPNDADHG